MGGFSTSLHYSNTARILPFQDASRLQTKRSSRTSLEKISNFDFINFKIYQGAGGCCFTTGLIRLKIIKTQTSLAVISNLTLKKVALLIIKFSKIIDPFDWVFGVIFAF